MSADLLTRLASAGTPMDLIMEVAEALADAKAAERILEKRREKDRDRKRFPRKSEESAESAEICGTASPLAPPLKNPPDPKNTTPPISPQPKKDSARGSRLPEDWQPKPLSGKAAAMIALWKPGEVERELAKFRNYWLSKSGAGATSTCWQRNWVNWLINADERKPRNGTQQQSSLRGTRPDPALDLLRAARAAEAAERESGADYRRAGASLPALGRG